MAKNKEEFNKLILKTSEENEYYALKECFFLDSGRFPDMYNALYDCYSVFWTPRSYKDMQIVEQIKKSREEYFGTGHVRSSYASLGDLILYLAREAKKQLPGTKLEDHIHVMMRSMRFYRMDIHNKRQVAKLISSNAYYFEDTEGNTLYSIFGFPRNKDEHRLVVSSILKQYIYLHGKGMYTKGLYNG